MSVGLDVVEYGQSWVILHPRHTEQFYSAHQHQCRIMKMYISPRDQQDFQEVFCCIGWTGFIFGSLLMEVTIYDATFCSWLQQQSVAFWIHRALIRVSGWVHVLAMTPTHSWVMCCSPMIQLMPCVTQVGYTSSHLICYFFCVCVYSRHPGFILPSSRCKVALLWS